VGHAVFLIRGSTDALFIAHDEPVGVVEITVGRG
jgi:hypothetical protein